MSDIDINAYAKANGIEMYREYSAEEAARLLKVGVNLFRSARAKGEINYLSIGGRGCYLYLGKDMVEWKLSKYTRSETTGSASTKTVTGTVANTSPEPSKSSQLASAQKIFN